MWTPHEGDLVFISGRLRQGPLWLIFCSGQGMSQIKKTWAKWELSGPNENCSLNYFTWIVKQIFTTPDYETSIYNLDVFEPTFMSRLFIKHTRT